MDRRSFIKFTVFGVGTAIFGGAIYQIVRELTGAEEAEQEEDRFFTVGAVADFVPGSVSRIEAETANFYLIRRSDHGFLALSSVCTHQRCDVPWNQEERQFQCPCHGSVFAADGAVIHPPAPRPLDIHPINIEDGLVVVNIGRRLRREKADNEYVVYAP